MFKAIVVGTDGSTKAEARGEVDKLNERGISTDLEVDRIGNKGRDRAVPAT